MDNTVNGMTTARVKLSSVNWRCRAISLFVSCMTKLAPLALVRLMRY